MKKLSASFPTPEIPFYLEAPLTRRPLSDHTAYVDGTAGKNFRPTLDIELSHWIPNQTPKQYRSTTSTAICFKFLHDPQHSPYDLVVNNHLDIDGLLSVFVLSYPSISLLNEDILCKVAEMGDFWDCGSGKAFYLFQELTLLMQACLSSQRSLHDPYNACIALVWSILKSPNIHHKDESIFHTQDDLIQTNQIQRQEITPHFSTYFIPKELTKNNISPFLNAPEFCEPITHRLALWPQVRNRYDKEKIQLIGAETDGGIYYTLWYPGYIWADTENLWRPRNLIDHTGNGIFSLECPLLKNAVALLNEKESQTSCRWALFPSLSLENQKNPLPFPIAAATLTQKGLPYPSSLSLEAVTQIFKKAFEG